MASALDKNARYDRQLRLWGEGGQQKLEASRLLLINGTATGTEILKNLVLPGVGSFTILDGGRVEEADLGRNFFVTLDSLGKSRAQVTTELLKELNNFVEGDFLAEDPLSVLQNDPNFFTKFSLVIATNVPEEPLLKLADLLYKANIPLVVARSYGFLGYLRIAVPEHPIVESKIDDAPDDLRLHNPFPELLDFAASIDLDSLDESQHSHIPYVVLLLKLLKEWQDKNGGKTPSNTAEKNEFKKFVSSRSRKPGEEDNFVQAVNNAFKLYASKTLPSDIQRTFSDPKTSTITSSSTNFWIIARALKDFVENEGHGSLPLSGDLPDMTSDTQTYIRLQEIYGEKAGAHFSSVRSRVHQLLQSVGRDPNSISDSEIKLYCKNARFLNFIRYRSLAQEHSKDFVIPLDIESEGDQIDNKVFYIALRAAERFNVLHGHYPGATEMDQDLAPFQEVVSNILSELSLPTTTVPESVVQEVTRFGAVELQTIAAVIGGIGAQEIVKLITQQYTPMNNTYLFNGIISTSSTFEA